ncbi:MAG: Gfo/Idh/MocA family oxidoreductase [Candidatus Brocadiae bacterium]|nr:Gfo/Idh/MocA family oxidoreductase [Candidatus Brocadiia bacterium]
MAKTVRVGVIGTGGIATRQARRLAELDDVEIVAGCDVSEENLRKFAEKYEVPHTFSDFNEMVQLEEMDAVTVCTPNYMHKDPTIAALKAGKHVMVEKPMAMNAGEAQAMVDAAEQSEAELTMGFQFRLAPEAQAIKRFVDEGRLGKVLFARCQALRRRGIPSWGVFGQKELQGGGPLIDIGVHIMECAHYLMGEPKPVAASAQIFTYLGNREPAAAAPWGPWDWKTYTVEDLAIGIIRFDNGAVMSVESSFAAHIKEDVLNCQLMGEEGGCVLHPPTIFADQAGTMINIEPHYVGKYQAMDKKIEDWIGRVRGEVETQCPAIAGLHVQKMLDGLYASAEAGKEVPIE